MDVGRPIGTLAALAAAAAAVAGAVASGGCGGAEKASPDPVAEPAPRAAPRPVRGILGQPAPAWNVTHWDNLPASAEALDIDQLRGKVVFVLFFQSWCPACHTHGFPTLKKVAARLADREDVAFVAIQTVFEGYSFNTPDKARATTDEFELAIPVGHDGGPEKSRVMRRYRTGGTPWVVIIDRAGTVRYNDYFIKPSRAIALIQKLLAASPGG